MNNAIAIRQTPLSQAYVAAGTPQPMLPGSLSPEGLLIFCQAQLGALDKTIQERMAGQRNLIAKQNALTELRTALSTAGLSENGPEANLSDAQMHQLNLAFDAAIAKAGQMGDRAMVQKLTELKNGPLHQGDDFKLNAGEMKAMFGSIDGMVNEGRSGAELNMIEIQSLVSKRATALQLTTSMLSSTNESAKSIAGNIGR